MDSYRIGGSTGVGGGGGDGQPQRPGQVPASSAEDFPALPTSQQSIGQLDERGMGLGPMGQRPSMSLEGGRILPGQLDSIPQQRAMVMGELEKKVRPISWLCGPPYMLWIAGLFYEMLCFPALVC
jgi:hypothetical protein